MPPPGRAGLDGWRQVHKILHFRLYSEAQAGERTESLVSREKFKGLRTCTPDAVRALMLRRAINLVNTERTAAPDACFGFASIDSQHV